MKSETSGYKARQGMIWGTVVGGLLGLLVGKFAIGLLGGVFVGCFVDFRQRKASASPDDSMSGEERSGP